ncbi:uncharacterized protein BT62DRAFT_927146 [Guyanagaster necrorhizus]|uniref:Uncharacterized protein n=1 Tax=Guyanagaster necrorhizus TaxID=856835 RepID=A0A9P7W2G8_9AGAR|nr:uncharacterized protein BT62DRAFT_927146 [Guyanagaster necrorhizus MCA 3950]KAG7451442.1 hypothetical protein BT62DRAFT_927146 [Guyanagaster necrorhizus MCA 3950]
MSHVPIDAFALYYHHDIGDYLLPGPCLFRLHVYPPSYLAFVFTLYYCCLISPALNHDSQSSHRSDRYHDKSMIRGVRAMLR